MALTNEQILAACGKINEFRVLLAFRFSTSRGFLRRLDRMFGRLGDRFLLIFVSQSLIGNKIKKVADQAYYFSTNYHDYPGYRG